MASFRKKKRNGNRNDYDPYEPIDLNEMDMDMTTTRRHTTKTNGTKGSRNRQVQVITWLFVLIFLGWIAYFCYFMIVQSDSVINNTYNTRTDIYSKQVTRGAILSDDGTVLAQTQVDATGNEYRSYPYGRAFAHVVGYTIRGSAGIESSANFYMLRSHQNILNKILNQLTGTKAEGDNVVTTLDVNVQQAAYNALGSFNGAVVALDPTSGKILAMVSTPSFDPNTLAAEYDIYTAEDSDSSVLLNRAMQGLYPPGSTFKVLTTLAYLNENGSGDGFYFNCVGEVSREDTTIHCFNSIVHGEEDLQTAFAKSCNSAFATIGLSLDRSAYIELCKHALFLDDSQMPAPLSYKASSFSMSTDSGIAEVMQTAIGQGNTLVTPYNMALIAAAIANDGTLMTPYLVDRVESVDGSTVRSFSPSAHGALLDASHIPTLKTYMRETVLSGTATALQSSLYTAAGKTGTAEFSDTSDSAHAWFIGYADNGDKSIAIAVLVEDSGSAGSYSVPVAKAVFDTYFSE